MKLELHNADCMEIMKQYEDNYFDLAITDPPYGINAGVIHSGEVRKTKTRNRTRHAHEPKRWDESMPDLSYFIELERVSKNRVVWGFNYFANLLGPSRGFIVWDKVNGNNSFAAGEIAFTSFDRNAEIFKYMWNGMHQGQYGGDKSNNEKLIHPTQKPVELYKWLYANYAKPNMKILDTHLGSGSNAIAAYEMNMGEFVGCELDEDYFKASKKRIDQALSQQKLF